MRTNGVLDCEFVQAEFFGELQQLLMRWSAEVHPYEGTGDRQLIRDIRQREALRYERAPAIDTR